MAKLIVVWGSPVSGKTVFSCVLASELAKNNKKVLLISANTDIPMLPILLSNQRNSLNNSNSIDVIFSADKINSSIVASSIHVLKSYNQIGVMGYREGEIPYKSTFPSKERIESLLEITKQLVDYVIWDCSSTMEGINKIVLEYFDIAIGLFTPDLRGIYYYGMCKVILKDEKYHFSKHLLLAGMARPYHAIEELSFVMGGLKGILPFTKELERHIIEGNYFNLISHCHKKYIETVENVMKNIELIS